MTWLIYFAKVALVQLLAFGGYKLLLEKEWLGQGKRLYLVGSLLASFVLPLLPVYTVPDTTPLAVAIHDLYGQTDLKPATAEDLATMLVNAQENTFAWERIALLLFLIIGCYNCTSIFRYLRQHRKRLAAAEVIAKDGYRLAVLPYTCPPHAFGRTVFIGNDRKIHPAVLAHEVAHARQWHSLDRTVVTVLRSFCWFLPTGKLYDNALLLVHEELADRAALDSGVSRAVYQNLLLNSLAGVASPQLASGFDFSITKKRLQMMSSSSPQRSAMAAKWLGLAGLWVGLALLTGSTVYAQQTPPPPPPPPTMTSAGALPTVGPIAQMDFSRHQLNEWSDPAVYGVWLDGKRIEKSQLAELEIAELHHYHVSRLMPNAVNYGKHDFQVDITTKAAYQMQERSSRPPVPRRTSLKDTKMYHVGAPPPAHFLFAGKLDAPMVKKPATGPEKLPSQTELNRWQDGDHYLIYLDHRQIANSKLATMEAADFHTYYQRRILTNDLVEDDAFYMVYLVSKKKAGR